MLEISLGSTTLENTGGGCMVMFINVLSSGKLEQISYDGETVVGLNCKWQEAEDGIQPENELWYAYDWQTLMDIVGVKVTLDIAAKVYSTWKWTDNLDNKEAVERVRNLIDFINCASQMSCQWHETLEAGYPFKESFDDMLLDVFNWQQVVINQEPLIYKRLKKAVEDGAVKFESRNSGQEVTDPFFDETLRWAVDPIEYYGFDIIYQLAGKENN